MSHIKKLEELIRTDIMLEVVDTLEELEEAKKDRKNKDAKEEYQYMKDIKKYFDEVLTDIEKKVITEDEALDILEGLEDMKAENQEV